MCCSAANIHQNIFNYCTSSYHVSCALSKNVVSQLLLQRTNSHPVTWTFTSRPPPLNVLCPRCCPRWLSGWLGRAVQLPWVQAVRWCVSDGEHRVLPACRWSQWLRHSVSAAALTFKPEQSFNFVSLSKLWRVIQGQLDGQIQSRA